MLLGSYLLCLKCDLQNFGKPVYFTIYRYQSVSQASEPKHSFETAGVGEAPDVGIP